MLYETDETAWLEATADLVREGRLAEVDCVSLAEYLSDMARRDRREVLSRLAVLIAHLLKWQYQPEHRSRSWQLSLEVQRQELMELLGSGVLQNYASEILEKAYANGLKQAVVESGLLASAFPLRCPFSVESLLAAPDLPGET